MCNMTRDHRYISQVTAVLEIMHTDFSTFTNCIYYYNTLVSMGQEIKVNINVYASFVLHVHVR